MWSGESAVKAEIKGGIQENKDSFLRSSGQAEPDSSGSEGFLPPVKTVSLVIFIESSEVN